MLRPVNHHCHRSTTLVGRSSGAAPLQALMDEHKLSSISAAAKDLQMTMP